MIELASANPDHFSFSSSFAASTMTRSKITPNPPPSSRNPSSQALNPPRARGASSSQAERPAPSRPNLAQATPPITGGAPVPPPDFKKHYPWANSTLLMETSSVNTAGAVLRLTKGDQPHQTFHKEQDEKMIVLPCPPPICPFVPTIRRAMTGPSASSTQRYSRR